MKEFLTALLGFVLIIIGGALAFSSHIILNIIGIIILIIALVILDFDFENSRTWIFWDFFFFFYL